jgi:hypothetical protein
LTLSARHAVISASRWQEAPVDVASVTGLLSIHFEGGSIAMLIAANATQWRSPVAPWLHIDSDMSASLVARELGTLSFLVDLRDVVLSSGDGHIKSHARIVHELLKSDPASLTTPVATIDHAFNRPLPLRVPTIWISHGSSHDETVTLVNIFAASDEEVESSRLH